MGYLVKLLINALAVAVSAYILPSVRIDSFLTAILVAFVLSLVNTFVKPVVSLFALPITLITLGLFSIVINGAMILIASHFVPGFIVDGFLAAILFSFVLSVVSSVLGIFAK